MSKQRNGFPSETHVRRGRRFTKGGEIELAEKLGRNDPCPCGSRARFQEVLHDLPWPRRRRAQGVLGSEA